MQIAVTLKRHPGRTAVAVVVLMLLSGFALYWFAPWNLFIDRTVNEALPTVDDAGATEEASPRDTDQVGSAEAAASEGDGAGSAPESVTLASGEFGSLEHATEGTALLIELEDGSRFLRLEDLETSNGPDLRVYLTDQPLSDDWYVWDDGAFVDLGALKGNLGSSNYEILAGVDLADFETVVVWCRRFSVGFGVAPLERP